MTEEQKQDIEAIKALKQEGESLIEAMRQKAAEIKSFASDAESIKEEIKAKRSSVTTASTQIQTRATEVEGHSSAIVALEHKAKELVDKISTTHDEVENYYKEFEELRAKLDDEEDGLDVNFEWVKKRKTEAVELLQETQAVRASVKELQEQSKKDRESVASHHADIENYRKEIEKTYNFMIGAGLDHSFADRQKSLQKSVWAWLVVVIGAVVLLVFQVRSLFDLPQMQITDATTFSHGSLMLLYRLAFTSPAIFAVWFAVLQYSRERRLLESYAFKSATAKALENYTEVLTRRFSEQQFGKEILSFVLGSMKNIYKHPNDESHGKVVVVDPQEPSILDEFKESAKEVSEKVVIPVADMAKKIANVATPAK